MIKVGVLGAYRGTSMINYCVASKNKAQVVAICDKSAEVLERQKAAHSAENIAYYDNFDDFIAHDMDAVVLANYATEHAPFAVKCLKRGLHVFSEVLPCQTMKEAVELIEAVEESGKVYAYGENYCYMPTIMEMKRLYKQGKIGEIEYGEGEYIHLFLHLSSPIFADIPQTVFQPVAKPYLRVVIDNEICRRLLPIERLAKFS